MDGEFIAAETERNLVIMYYFFQQEHHVHNGHDDLVVGC